MVYREKGLFHYFLFVRINMLVVLQFYLIDDLSEQVAQATSNQMSKRDPLRPYMNVIDNMLTQMVLPVIRIFKQH